jgi:hypothetical protein
MELAPDFNEFVGSLNAHHVEFLVVGAYALALHGAPRFTGDLDILVRPTPDNLGRLLDAVRAFGFPATTLTPEDLLDPRRMLQMGIEPVQIHIMTSITGVTWHEAWEDRVAARLGDHDAHFIGRAAFLRNKRAAGRLKDLADAEAIDPGGDRSR